MSNQNAIEVHELVVSYGDTVVIDNLSFEIKKGEVVAILGPNGSGKSTLVKAILGLVPADHGQIHVLGNKIGAVLTEIGYLPQRFAFDRDFPMTVREFLALSLRNKKETERIDEKLDEVDMRHKVDALLGTLSGGQLQRVLIARAILNDPKILILDEPEAGIDVEAEKNFYDLIRLLNKKHKMTTIFISHEIDVVYDLAQQVICLNKRMICHGAPKKVLTPDKMQELYGGGIAHHHHTHK